MVFANKLSKSSIKKSKCVVKQTLMNKEPSTTSKRELKEGCDRFLMHFVSITFNMPIKRRTFD